MLGRGMAVLVPVATDRALDLYGDFTCGRPCGSGYDCGSTERCSAAVYDYDTTAGYGI